MNEQSVFIPSRTINEVPTIFGLSVMDLALLIGIYTFSQQVLFYVQLEVVSLFIVVAATIVLIPIRRQSRRHIIRDWILYAFVKITRRGVFYDPIDPGRGRIQKPGILDY